MGSCEGGGGADGNVEGGGGLNSRMGDGKTEGVTVEAGEPRSSRIGGGGAGGEGTGVRASSYESSGGWPAAEKVWGGKKGLPSDPWPICKFSSAGVGAASVGTGSRG